MKGLLVASTMLAALWSGACGAGDDVASGARAECAAGGVLTDCPDAPRTAEDACWRLVECGAIPLDHPEDFRLDWGTCVDRIQSQPEQYERLIVSCVAASTCDQLRANGSPDQPNTDQIYCLQLGEQ